MENLATDVANLEHLETLETVANQL